MEVYTVSFFGHRQIDNPVFIDSELEKLIVRLLLEKEYVQFLVGRDGDFDLLVSSSFIDANGRFVMTTAPTYGYCPMRPQNTEKIKKPSMIITTK